MNEDDRAASVVLAIDTGTTRVVVAAGDLTGGWVESTDWPAGYRHGETLLATIGSFLAEHRVDRVDLAAIVVGTGPGAFTGLRVGIATAKGLAHALGRPIIGISTAAALLADAPTGAVLLLPAGPSDRIMIADGVATLLPAGDEPDVDAARPLVAVDLPDRAPVDAIARGDVARAGLGRVLVRLGLERLATDDVDDLARLVPEYVTLPRGVRSEGGEVAWSHDRR